MQQGSIDICLQSHVAGWAVENGQPAVVSVFVNDAFVGASGANHERLDLTARGHPPDAGYHFCFDEPLTVHDVVSVRFQSGEHVDGSPTSRHAERLKLLLHGIGLGPGIEVGPLDRPLLSKFRYDVSYVDHESQQGLRDKYAVAGKMKRSLVDPSRIAPVDYVWRGCLSQSVQSSKFCWAVACGVVEHVPDPIGWLQQLAEVLIPGGRLVLEVPDARLTFDHRRRLTTVAELLDDHQRKLERPSFKHIYDHVSRASPIGSSEPSLKEQIKTAKEAYNVSAAADSAGSYVDVHCHVWTSDSWTECWREIGWLDLFPFNIGHVTGPLPDSRQFIVSLIRL